MELPDFTKMTEEQIYEWLKEYTDLEQIETGDWLYQLLTGTDPGYVASLRSIRSSIHLYNDLCEPCECDDPSCIQASQHTHWFEPLRDALPGLEAAAERILRAVAHVIHEQVRCECIPCQLTRHMPEYPGLN